MKKTTVITVLALLAVHTEAEPIIVSAPRISTTVNDMASSVNIIQEDDIENTKQQSVPDLLQMVPGVSMSRSGGPGQQTSIYLRGAKPQHTLVMIDGVRMNGQLDLTGYNMANLQTLDIERIEILKGPQSALYGSDAMAGVINIITKKGKGSPAPYFDVEGGSYDTYRVATGVSGGTEALDYSASISYFERGGQSALKNNREKDGTENTTVTTRLGTQPTPGTDISLTLRYIDAESEYDDGFGTAHDDFKYDTEQLITRAEGTALVFDDLVETKLGASFLLIDRDEYGFDGFAASPTEGFFDAQTLSGDWGNTIYIRDNQTLVLGVDAYRDDFEYDDGFGDAVSGDLYNLGAFGTYQLFITDPWVLNAGIRHDDHSEFKAATTYQASTAYTFKPTRTKLKGSYGTGFKAPSSYQLYSTVFGNRNLEPEESRGWEIGVEQVVLTNRLSMGATYFNTKYDKLIDFDLTTFTFGNISKARTDGVEVYGNTTITDHLNIRIGYTYLDNDDESGGTFTLRRPKHQIDTEINYAATEKLNVNLYAGFVDERMDISGGIEQTLDPYVLVNLAARYQISQRVQLYGRIENLLNENYETVYGYNTDDISAYVGVKVNR